MIERYVIQAYVSFTFYHFKHEVMRIAVSLNLMGHTPKPFMIIPGSSDIRKTFTKYNGHTLPYEKYLNGTTVGGFSKKQNTIFSDYQNFGHHPYFPQTIFHVFSLIMALSIYLSIYKVSYKYGL